MRMKRLAGFLMVLGLLLGAFSLAETEVLTGAEIGELVSRVRELAAQEPVLNDPAAEDAASEDGFAFQYDFGVIYADQDTWTEETGINSLYIMTEEIPGPREIGIDWTVNGVMNAIPCDNPNMYGTFEEALLYLEGNAEAGFRYGRVERDGQRISAMEYGEVKPAEGTRTALILGISGDGVTSMRVEGMNELLSQEQAEEMYQELQALGDQYGYYRAQRSLIGTDLTAFREADLDFSALSYRTAVPEIFDDNVESMLIDNGDGTWLRRIDGDGFVAVFSCDSEGNNAVIRSYEILSPELEGPRFVRLGDLFHEDFTRFRSGEGELSEDGTTEVLYGTPGTAPYGIAEYGDGTEMTLRYVTTTLSGPEVELILRYQDTALSEIILHTLEEETEHAD